MQVLARTLLVCCVAASSLAAQAQAPAMQGQQGLNDGMVSSAAVEVPDLVKRLGLAPGMTVADIGAGFGAWTVAFGKFLGPGGRVYATDIGERQLAFLREYTAKEGLTNVTVLAAGERSTNLPAACCDAILVRDAYHHFTEPMDLVRSLSASLKPGGRLAIVDFPPRPGSSTPAGVPSNRGGHGIPIAIVIGEVTANGFSLVSQEPRWSPKSQPSDLFLALFRKN